MLIAVLFVMTGVGSSLGVLSLVWVFIIGPDIRYCMAIRYIINTHKTTWIDLKHCSKFLKFQLFPGREIAQW